AATSGMAKAPAGATGILGRGVLYGVRRRGRDGEALSAGGSGVGGGEAPLLRSGRGAGVREVGAKSRPSPGAVRLPLPHAGEGLFVVERGLAEVQDAAVAEHAERDRFQV